MKLYKATTIIGSQMGDYNNETYILAKDMADAASQFKSSDKIEFVSDRLLINLEAVRGLGEEG